jgi:hypothetical protein
VKVSVSVVWAAIVKAAMMFVPIPLRWVVRLVADLFAEQSKRMGAGALSEEVSAESHDALKAIIKGIFDTLADHLSDRPFMKKAVTLLGAFVVNNLVDLVFDLLFTKGETTAASGPAKYNPADASALEGELGVLVAMGC